MGTVFHEYGRRYGRRRVGDFNAWLRQERTKSRIHAIVAIALVVFMAAGIVYMVMEASGGAR